MPGVKPLTIVDKGGSMTLADLAARVIETRTEHADLLQRYHEVWYNAPHTWHYLHYMGVGMMKCPNDLWMYQQLIVAQRPMTIIETGTFTGASALYFAHLLDLLGLTQQGARVYSIDFEDHRQVEHPAITFLAGDSRDPLIMQAIVRDIHERNMTDAPLLVTLDADHSADHVRRELELYAPLVRPGEYLIVEDTNIAWGGECADRGARGGIEDYLVQHPGEFAQDVLCERWLLTMHPGGWLQRVAPHVDPNGSDDESEGGN